MTPKLFSELGLSAELLKAIDKLGFEQASPIQAASIPLLLQGRDIVGQSQTGSGKTAAFAVPAIEKVDPQRREVQVLVLCPTRELAVQVAEEVHKLALFRRGIHALPIYGGQSYERQFQGLRQGAQIVIGTPGRVMDHMRRGTLRLETVKTVVLDEADEMLDMGFREDIEFILQSVPAERQTVFFSATMPRPIQELIRKFSRDPQYVRIEQRAMTVPTVEQVYYEAGWGFKLQLLTRLIDLHDLKLGIVFCNTKRAVDDLVDHLNAQGYSADRLHGDMTQAMRDRVMNKFRKSGLEFLVATDVAARGIDVDDVQVVFNYDLPYDPEDYVHRIGRTGRAGRSGMAISFVSGRELFQVSHIERFTRTRIRRARVPTLMEVEEARANQMVEKLRLTLQAGEFKRQDHVVERLLEEGFTSTDIISALLHVVGGGEVATPPKPAREPATFAANGPATAVVKPGPVAAAAPEASFSAPPASPPAAPAPVEPAASAVTEPAPAPEPAPVTPPPTATDLVPESVPEPAAVAPAAAPPTNVDERPARPAPVTPPPRSVGKPTTSGSARPPAKPAEKPAAKPPFKAYSKPYAKPGDKPGDRPLPKQASKPFARAGVRPPDALSKTAPWKRPAVAGAMAAAKASRRTPEHQTRLFMNLGAEMGVAAGDVVGAILGETGLPAQVVGTVDIRERHLFVDVASESANAILSKLNRTRIKGNKVKAKVA